MTTRVGAVPRERNPSPLRGRLVAVALTMLTIVFMAVFSATALGGSPPSPTVSVIGDIGGPGQDPASVDVGFDAQTGHVSGGWDYFDRGQQFSAIATCLRYRVLASSVYDVVITAIKTYPGASEYVVLEVIDDDSPGGVDAARMSFQSNGGIKAGATPNCWAPVLTPVPLASNTIYVTGLATASTSPAPTVTVTRTMGGALSLPASVNVRLDGQTGQLSGEFNFYDEGQNHLATPTCLKYRVLAPSVYDVVITATANYAGEPPQHVVLEAIDNDSPGGTDAARVSFQRNDSVQQGTTPNCWVPIAGPVPISPNAVEIRPSTRPHLPPPAPPHRPAPRHESLRFTVSHVTTQADGTVTFRATVPGPGHIEVLETAPDDNPARIAALMQPGAHRYAFARGLTTAHSASTVDMRVKPSVRGKLLLRNHPAHVTLRLWVTYLPAVGRPHRVVIHDLHLPCLGDPDHDGDCDAPPN